MSDPNVRDATAPKHALEGAVLIRIERIVGGKSYFRTHAFTKHEWEQQIGGAQERFAVLGMKAAQIYADVSEHAGVPV